MRKSIAALLVLAASPWMLSNTAHALEVMLQGQSADTMAELVHTVGGKITHHLPAINAVGATLSREQLDSVLETGKVARHIDDLALEDQPEQRPEDPQKTTDCEVAGAVAIQPKAQGFSWRLYNKRESPAEITSIELDWPETLGAIQELRLNQQALSAELQPQPGEILITPGETVAIKPQASADLQVDFAALPDHTTLHQSAIKLTVAFTGDCTATLLPAYPENLSDYYYSEVTGADALHQQGVRGAGVTVAVLDSGLWEHPNLAEDTTGKPRIPVRYDAISGEEVSVAFDESGHGTHLTSALANSARTMRGGNTHGSFRGIAPDARIIPIKAFRATGQGSMLDIVRGVQWAIDNRSKYGIRIMNLSFAARPRWPYFEAPINQAVMRAWEAGIVVIAAAGNEGPGLMSVGSPGNSPYVITVGAVTDSWTPEDRSDDYIPDFSSRGPTPEAHIKPDLVAPGGHITGLIRPGSQLTRQHPEYLLEESVYVSTGSSQAAAIVSGLAALLLQLQPDLSPDDVKCKLLTGADPAINTDGLLAYSPFVQGQGYVNLIRSVLFGSTGCGNQGLDIARDLNGEEHFEGPAIVTENGDISLPALEQMLSPIPPTKGYSDTRKWGIKSHIERKWDGPQPPPTPHFNWQLLYEQEKARSEELKKEYATPP